MKKHIITEGTKLDVIDGIITIEAYNGDIFDGTIRRVDMIEEDGELILNPEGDGLLPAEDWRGTRGDLERALKEADGENHRVIWEEA